MYISDVGKVWKDSSFILSVRLKAAFVYFDTIEPEGKIIGPSKVKLFPSKWRSNAVCPSSTHHNFANIFCEVTNFPIVFCNMSVQPTEFRSLVFQIFRNVSLNGPKLLTCYIVLSKLHVKRCVCSLNFRTRGESVLCYFLRLNLLSMVQP